VDPAPAALVRQALVTELETRIATDPELGRPETAQKVVALVGPSGCGKTATLAKLAMREGIGARRSTLILSTDTHRVAAPDQLRAYAAILGLPFEVAESPAALSRLLLEHRQKALILIDTPGFSPRERECGQEWAAMLARHPDVETQLVLAATTRTDDLLASLRWWEVFSPGKLLFTRLDETTRPGGCLAAAMLSGKAVSYLGTGPGIPEDLEPASMAGISHLLLGSTLKAGAAA
jgi:flagellar biosynthesis protein FlhF